MADTPITAIRCLTCQVVTDHHIVQEHREIDHNSEDGTTLWSTWQIVRCAGCRTVTFVERSRFSEDADETGIPEQVRCYPRREAHARPVRSFPSVPENLSRIYRELMECFNGGAPTLCAAGLRAIVEGICADRGVVDGPVANTETGVVETRTNLQARIEGMAHRNLLTRAHATTLHEHRFLGNDAVHQLTVPNVANLAAAIHVIEHTLENIYELHVTAQRIRTSPG